MADWNAFNYSEFKGAIADAKAVLAEFGNSPVVCRAKMNPVGGEIVFNAEFDNRYNAIAYASMLKEKFSKGNLPFSVRRTSLYNVSFKRKV